MPLVGLGTWQMTGARCQQAVRSALEVGYRHIDTAAIYRNQRELGRAVGDSGVPREQVFVTTKLPLGDAGRERRTLDNSLRALGMDYVELWLVHWPPRGPGPGLDLEGAAGRPRPGAGRRGRSQQLQHGPNFDVFGFSLTDEELGRIDGLSTTRRR